MAQSWVSLHSAKLSVITAVASLAVMVGMVLLAGAFTPGYSHTSQLISELGASGAPFEWPVRLAGFMPSGVLLLGFCFSAYTKLPRSNSTALALAGLGLFATGYLVAAAFPCDFGCRPTNPSTSQLVHNAGGLAGYLVAPASLFALARSARSWPAAGALIVAGYVAAGLALLAVLTLSPNLATAGLSQRLLEASVLVWAVLCGSYLVRRSAGGALYLPKQKQ